MRAVIVCSVALLLVACSAPPPKPVPDSIINTSSGPVAGVSTTPGVTRWVDIPYAEPPVGDLRWRAPRSLENPKTEIVAFDDPVMCVQMPGATSGTEGEKPLGTEDCLYLDVVAPAAPGQGGKPVMFWIHGGGNTTGHKGTYDYSPLAAAEDVVVVSVNYRLGPFGWMTHPSLQTNAEGLDKSANFGTLDLIKALEWTRDNIAAFGGDPANITIFGESAGGHNVYALLASPLTDGLFHRAISQSGYTTSVTPRQAYNKNREFAQLDRGSWQVIGELGLNPETVSASKLRAVPAMELASAYYGIEKDHLEPLTTADGIVIPASGLQQALASPDVAKQVPVLAGSNRDEVTLWIGLDRYFVNADPVLFGLLPSRLSVRDETLFRFWVDIRSRGWKARGVDQVLSGLSSAGYDDLYAYRFDWDEQTDNYFLPFSKILGPAHGAEIAFVMGAPMYGPIGDYMYPDTESAKDMTRIMMSAWANFARNGKPGAVDESPWPPFIPQAPHTMVLDSNARSAITARQETVDGLLQEVAGDSHLADVERCILVWELLMNIGNPSYTGYRRWNDGECRDVNAREEKKRIRADLVARYGSASLP